MRGTKTKAAHAGHYYHGTLDFDEVNINGQCAGCNMYKSGDLAGYTEYIILKHGVEGLLALQERRKLARSGEIRSIEDYKEIIAKYLI